MNAKTQFTWITISIVGLLAVLVLVFSVESSSSQFADVLGLNSQFQTSSKISKTGLEKVKVKSVVDGDTIHLTDGRTLRYLNMDTPETKKINTPVRCYGPEASKYNKDQVDGKEIWILPDKEDTDRYGRYLRFIFLYEADTTKIENSLNAQMVKLGYAKTSIYKPNNTYEKDFWKFQKLATDQKLGVWGACPSPFET